MKRVRRKKIYKQHFEKEQFTGSVFDKLTFEECNYFNCGFIDCTWNYCDFYKVLFSRKTRFKNCIFNDCRFWGQYTYLGGPTKYINCEFVACEFKDIQFWDSIFEDCTFSDKMENIVFYGPESPGGWETKFKNVDLLNLKMELVDFRCGFDLSTTKIDV